MTELRRHFREDLGALEQRVLAIGDAAIGMLLRAAEALKSADGRLADDVIASDDAVDDLYLAIDRRVLELIAQQTPVAGDLRLVAAILHINLHLERVGDTAVTVAKIVKATQDLPRNEDIVARLGQMSDLVARMLRTALDAFTGRDLELALRVPDMDDPVDQLNRDMYEHVSACRGDPALLEWAMRMIVVSRQLERAGDHAVDIAEQVAFLLTGEFREFTDASHQVSPSSNDR
jgi:phosphate transport system protein